MHLYLVQTFGENKEDVSVVFLITGYPQSINNIYIIRWIPYESDAFLSDLSNWSYERVSTHQ